METLKIKKYRIAKDYCFSTVPENQTIINTINAHSWVTAAKDPVFKKALQESSVLLPDGVSIVWAAKFLKSENIRKLAGADLHSMILNVLDQHHGKCFYLGASPRALELIRMRMRREYPNVTVETLSPPYKDTFTKKENELIIEKINNFHPDVLFVGMTAPKQEKWIYENKSKINVKTIAAIGAVFDFYAGIKKRPNKLMVNSGLEWLGRLMSDPRRLWKRYLINNTVFVYQILKIKVNNK